MTMRKGVFRSSESGEFVTEKYAKSHPKTTEKEHVYVPAPKAACYLPCLANKLDQRSGAESRLRFRCRKIRPLKNG